MKLATAKEQALLDNLCGKSSSVSGIGLSGNCYLGVYKQVSSGTAGAIEFASGVYGVEVSGNNYARVKIDTLMNRHYKSHAKSEAAAQDHDDRIGNTEDINFNAAYDQSDPSAATGADWGTIVGFGLFTAATGGSPYAYGALEKISGSYPSVATHNTLHFVKGFFELYLDEASASASVS